MATEVSKSDAAKKRAAAKKAKEEETKQLLAAFDARMKAEKLKRSAAAKKAAETRKQKKIAVEEAAKAAKIAAANTPEAKAAKALKRKENKRQRAEAVKFEKKYEADFKELVERASVLGKQAEELNMIKQEAEKQLEQAHREWQATIPKPTKSKKAAKKKSGKGPAPAVSVEEQVAKAKYDEAKQIVEDSKKVADQAAKNAQEVFDQLQVLAPGAADINETTLEAIIVPKTPGSEREVHVYARDESKIEGPVDPKRNREFRRMLDAGDLNGAYALWENGSFKENGKTKDFTKLWEALGGKRWYVNCVLADDHRTHVSFPLTGDQKPNFEKIMKRDFKSIFVIDPEDESDTMVEIKERGIVSFELEAEFEGVTQFQKSAGFFPFVHDTEIDLLEYQICKDPKDKAQKAIVSKNCLLFCLEHYGVPDKTIQEVVLALGKGSHTKVSDLPLVSNIIKRNIKLDWYRNSDVSAKLEHQLHTPDLNEGQVVAGDTIALGMIENHYIVQKQTKYTEYSIRNYKDIKDKKDWHNIYRSTVTNGKTYYKYKDDEQCARITSLRLIKIMMEENCFHTNADLFECCDEMSKYIIKDVTKIDLSNIENDQRLFKKKFQMGANYTIFYADTECFVSKMLEGVRISDIHGAFMLGVLKSKAGDQLNREDVKVFIKSMEDNGGKLWVLKFMDYIVKNTEKGTVPLVYFHNLKYDVNVLAKYINFASIREKEGNMYNALYYHNATRIEFRDSYKMIAEPLSAFQEAFKLHESLGKKEAIAYAFYTELNTLVNNARVKVEEYAKLLPVKYSPKDLKDNLKKEPVLFEYNAEEGTFNALEYYKYYLCYDVLTLNAGMKKFAETVQDVTKINMFEYTTISSLTNGYMTRNGAFKNLYEVKGVLRDYVSRAINGGRVECNKSHVGRVINHLVTDLDAKSLYPSSLKRICDEKGLPCGPAYRIPANSTLKELQEKTSYFIVTVCITAINKKQQIPFVIHRDQKGCRTINEITPAMKNNEHGGLCLVIDQFTLEDWIEFQQIEYTILDGVCWNGVIVGEGEDSELVRYNKTIGKLIEKLYAQRKQFKKAEEDVKQKLMKLMLNSAYGKTIIKKSHVKSTLVSTEGFDRYRFSRFNTISTYESFNENSKKVFEYCADNSYNLCHVGVMCLGMSKRIMNEVMNLANDIKVEQYYQDTDSMMLKHSQLPDLEKAYFEKYGRVLIGGDLGQFGIDFQLHDKNGKEIKGLNVVAHEAIFLGKKCYAGALQATYDHDCPNGTYGKGDAYRDSDGKIVVQYHLRLKGVTEEGIEYKVWDKANSDSKTPESEKTYYQGNKMAMMKDLAKKPMNFCLNPEELGKPSFVVGSGQVYTRKTGSFCRELNFQYTPVGETHVVPANSEDITYSS